MTAMPRVVNLSALALIALTACSTHGPTDEDMTYEPVMPRQPEAAEVANGAIFQPIHAASLIEDRRARRVGDILTIRLVERTDASKSMNTNTTRDSSTRLEPPTVLGRGVTDGGVPVLDTEIDSSRSFDGGGESSQSNSLQGEITVTVSRRLANGNLLVQGQKRLTLNQGQEMLRIAGIVRTEDIASDNSVPSNRVADARITYSGKGSLAAANRQGWLTRFFNSPLSPF